MIEKQKYAKKRQGIKMKVELTIIRQDLDQTEKNMHQQYLSFLIESHDNNCCTVAFDNACFL